MRRAKTSWRLLGPCWVALVLAVGCGGDGKNEARPESGMTQSERDSTIAASDLPGAGAVGGALAVSDSARARAKRLEADQP